MSTQPRIGRQRRSISKSIASRCRVAQASARSTSDCTTMSPRSTTSTALARELPMETLSGRSSKLRTSMASLTNSMTYVRAPMPPLFASLLAKGMCEVTIGQLLRAPTDLNLAFHLVSRSMRRTYCTRQVGRSRRNPASRLSTRRLMVPFRLACSASVIISGLSILSGMSSATLSISCLTESLNLYSPSASRSTSPKRLS